MKNKVAKFLSDRKSYEKDEWYMLQFYGLFFPVFGENIHIDFSVKLMKSTNITFRRMKQTSGRKKICIVVGNLLLSKFIAEIYDTFLPLPKYFSLRKVVWILWKGISFLWQYFERKMAKNVKINHIFIQIKKYEQSSDSFFGNETIIWVSNLKKITDFIMLQYFLYHIYYFQNIFIEIKYVTWSKCYHFTWWNN